MPDQPNKYDYLSYNRYDVLRLNWLYWVIVLFLTRHIVVLMVLGFARGKSGAGPSNAALASLIDPLFFVSDVPAIILLMVTGARLPSGKKTTRSLWKNGRYFMSASCFLYIALLLWQQGAQILSAHPLTWVLMAVNVGVVVVTWRSRYLKDLFDQFPEPEADPKK